jgi:membrane-bound metal-dependent hydrolase YbcI (DUF457 family)
LDNLTHSLFAATLARTPLGRAGRGTTATLLVASNAPDLDIIAAAGGGANYLQWHRGMTHGPLGLIGLAILSAAIVEIARRIRPAWRRPEEDASFAMLIGVALIGVVFHVLMDLPTTYGVRLLSPFSWRWYSVDWMPIVDVYLLLVLGSGLMVVRPTAAAADPRRRNAAIVMVLMAVNYGIRAYAHNQALEIAPRLFGPTLPHPCDPGRDMQRGLTSWPLPAPSPPREGTRCLVEIAAIPTFFSPFDWRIIAQMSNAFEIHDVNVLDSRFREPERDTEVFWRQVLRYPNVWSPAVQRAAATDLGQVFLGFSRFPAARSAVDATGTTTVRFTDVRFVGGPIASDQPVRRVQPFTTTIRLDANGRVISETLGQ